METKILSENTIWKIELISSNEIKIHGEYKTSSMHIVLIDNKYYYYGSNYILPKYINKIVENYLPIK